MPGPAPAPGKRPPPASFLVTALLEGRWHPQSWTDFTGTMWGLGPHAYAVMPSPPSRERADPSSTKCSSRPLLCVCG